MNRPLPVVLASRSAYRRELLGRLLADFVTAPADVDESRRPGEVPRELAERLARTKALACATTHPGHIVIGSDQVAALGDQVLGKPGTAQRAVSQLGQCAGQAVDFHTAVCVLAPGGHPEQVFTDHTVVRFRPFTEAEAQRYVAADQPLDCAGSFKAEKAGVMLFERIETGDPTAIQGLPLIWLAGALRRLGLPMP